MSRYLIFQLYAPLVSWGEAAVGEVRHTSTVPSRSALLGLLAAALGIKREDEQQIQSFNQHYQFAIRPLSSREQWLRDYHTVQVPKENRKRRYYTRRDELILSSEEPGTMLTSREYRCDACYHIAVRETPDAPFALEALAAALRMPVFPLYLGRKSCPPALPLNPQIIEGTLAEVFHKAYGDSSYGFHCEELAAISSAQLFCVWEGEHEGVSEFATQQRSDQPLSRARWQFTTRVQHSGNLTEEC
ncbi:type I-E CRISPR-associated protein Cas5/CasD [Buttiauxella selenatireducens]|uniref:Type I-E CRISPR-associated protein Cas5/CasD n=1 Tax=Buttiauxella selenatireducens TaxID=3073902 RepID=A0ABY9SCW2_9ENTR|nr:type I-E CRISPR-associated protein Cas5/CasD [Buttiauxella sp. R73]WMY75234.1 type I-E CRISPR-associated protein Cas5/CasD [Buttiauxella sp. R73]